MECLKFMRRASEMIGVDMTNLSNLVPEGLLVCFIL